MKISSKLLLFILGVLSLIIVAACGGGGGGGGGGDTDPVEISLLFKTELGPIVGADVTVYRITDLENPVAGPVVTTDVPGDLAASGLFEVDLSALDDSEWVVFKVSGGHDIDANDDGVIDDVPTENQGAFYALVKVGDYKEYGLVINPLTDMMFQYVRQYFQDLDEDEINYGAIYSEIQKLCDALITDVNGDGVVDYKDVMLFEPSKDKNKYKADWDHLLAAVVTKIHDGSYTSDRNDAYNQIIRAYLPGDDNDEVVTGDKVVTVVIKNTEGVVEEVKDTQFLDNVTIESGVELEEDGLVYMTIDVETDYGVFTIEFPLDDSGYLAQDRSTIINNFRNALSFEDEGDRLHFIIDKAFINSWADSGAKVYFNGEEITAEIVNDDPEGYFNKPEGSIKVDYINPSNEATDSEAWVSLYPFYNETKNTIDSKYLILVDGKGKDFKNYRNTSNEFSCDIEFRVQSTTLDNQDSGPAIDVISSKYAIPHFEMLDDSSYRVIIGQSGYALFLYNSVSGEYVKVTNSCGGEYINYSEIGTLGYFTDTVAIDNGDLGDETNKVEKKLKLTFYDSDGSEKSIDIWHPFLTQNPRVYTGFDKEYTYKEPSLNVENLVKDGFNTRGVIYYGSNINYSVSKDGYGPGNTDIDIYLKCDDGTEQLLETRYNVVNSIRGRNFSTTALYNTFSGATKSNCYVYAKDENNVASERLLINLFTLRKHASLPTSININFSTVDEGVTKSSFVRDQNGNTLSTSGTLTVTSSNPSALAYENGSLVAKYVSVNTNVTVTATYTFNGITVTTNKVIAVKDVKTLHSLEVTNCPDEMDENDSIANSCDVRATFYKNGSAYTGNVETLSNSNSSLTWWTDNANDLRATATTLTSYDVETEKPVFKIYAKYNFQGIEKQDYGTIIVYDENPLENITITGNSNMGDNDQQQLTATGDYRWGDDKNITNSVTWSENSTYCSFSNTTKGLFITSNMGFNDPSSVQCTVTASLDGVNETKTMTIDNAEANPAAFSFDDQTGVVRSTEITSNQITVSGINIATDISITGGSFRINGGAWRTTATTVNNGDTVEVKVTSSADFNTKVTAILTIGDQSDNFDVTTLQEDVTPDTFTLTDVSDADLNTEYTSNKVTVSGINNTANVSITGGSYRISTNGGVSWSNWTTASGTVNSADQIEVKVTSSGSLSTSVTATLTVGTFTETYVVTTYGPDTTPTAFQFADEAGVDLSTDYTDAITVDGINTASAISITGGFYRVSSDNGGTWSQWSDIAGTVNNGNQVEVKVTSSSSYSTISSATLTIGGVSDTFSVTTMGDTTAPTVTDKSSVHNNDFYENSLLGSGKEIIFSETLKTTAGSYSVVLKNAAGTEQQDVTANVVVSGNKIDLSAVVLPEVDEDTEAYLYIRVQDQSGNELVVDGAADIAFTILNIPDETPEQFTFSDVSGAELDTLYERFVTISGIDTQVPISISNGEYKVNDGSWTSAVGSVSNGDVVTVRLTSSNAYETQESSIITIGGVQDIWVVTTKSSVPVETTVYTVSDYFPIVQGSALQYDQTYYEIDMQRLNRQPVKSIVASSGSYCGHTLNPFEFSHSEDAGATFEESGYSEFFKYEADGLYFYGAVEEDEGVDTTFCMPGTGIKVLPLNVEAGDTGSSSVQGDIFGEGVVTIESVYEVLLAENLVINETTYETLKIKFTTIVTDASGNEEDNVTTYVWFAKGVGIVKTDSDDDTDGGIFGYGDSVIMPLGSTIQLSTNYKVYGGNTEITGEDGYHPADFGYTLLGTADSTAAFFGNYNYYIIVTDPFNVVNVDAVMGDDLSTYTTSNTGNTLYWENVGGMPDGSYAIVGGEYGASAGGYISINASSNTTMTSLFVNVVDGIVLPDTTPAAFSFNDVTNAELSTDYTDIIQVADTDASSFLGITGGEFRVSSDNGSTWSEWSGTTDYGYVSAGDKVEVKVTSSSSYNTTTSVTLTIGGVSDTFSVTTKDQPAAGGTFTTASYFPLTVGLTNVYYDTYYDEDEGGLLNDYMRKRVLADTYTCGSTVLNLLESQGGDNETTFSHSKYYDLYKYKSDGLYLYGFGQSEEQDGVFDPLSVDCLPVEIKLFPATFQVGDTDTYQASFEMQGQNVVASHTYDIQAEETILVRGVSYDTIRVYSRFKLETTAGMVISDYIKTFWFANGVGVVKVDSVDELDGGFYGGLGDADLISTSVNTGGTSDTTPDAFTLTDKTSADISTVYETSFTVSGIDTTSPISVTGGYYKVNDGEWTEEAGTVNNGDVVYVKNISSGFYSTAVNTVLTIGGVSDTFTITTESGSEVAHTYPIAFMFAEYGNGEDDGPGSIYTLNGFGTLGFTASLITYSAVESYGDTSSGVVPYAGFNSEYYTAVDSKTVLAKTRDDSFLTIATMGDDEGYYNIGFGIKPNLAGFQTAVDTFEASDYRMLVMAQDDSSNGLNEGELLSYYVDIAAANINNGSVSFYDLFSQQNLSLSFAQSISVQDGVAFLEDAANNLKLMISPDASLFVITLIDESLDSDARLLALGMKKTSGKTNASLNGNYSFVVGGTEHSESNEPAILNNAFAQITFNGDGTCSVKELYASYPESSEFNCTYSVSDNGEMTFTASGQTFRGAVSADNEVAAFVLHNDSNESFIAVGTKFEN